MKKRQTKEQKALDAHINDIFRRRANCVQIKIMDLSVVFNAGRLAATEGRDIETAMVASIETVRQN